MLHLSKVEMTKDIFPCFSQFLCTHLKKVQFVNLMVNGPYFFYLGHSTYGTIQGQDTSPRFQHSSRILNSSSNVTMSWLALKSETETKFTCYLKLWAFELNTSHLVDTPNGQKQTGHQMFFVRRLVRKIFETFSSTN